MARSRRAPVATQGYGGRWRKVAKRAANGRVRHSEGEEMGSRSKGAYKRKYNSWDICDWKFKLDDTKKNRSK